MNQDSTTGTVRVDERILGTTNELFTQTKKHEHTHGIYTAGTTRGGCTCRPPDGAHGTPE